MHLERTALVAPMFVVLVGCACGSRSTQEVAADLDSYAIAGISNLDAPTREDCESMCRSTADNHASVESVTACELTIETADGTEPADTGADGPTGHVTCTITVRFLCE